MDCNQDKYVSEEFLTKYNFASSAITKNILSGTSGAVCRDPTKKEIDNQCEKLGKNYMWNDQIKSCAPVSVSPNDWFIQILQTSSNSITILVGWPEENLKKSGISNFKDAQFTMSLVDLGNNVNDSDLDPPGGEPEIKDNLSPEEYAIQEKKLLEWQEKNKKYNQQMSSKMEDICTPIECNDDEDDTDCTSNMKYICPYYNYLIDKISWYFDDKSDSSKISTNSVQDDPRKERKINEVGLPENLPSKRKVGSVNSYRCKPVFSSYISNVQNKSKN